MEAPALLLYALIAIAAVGISVALLYPRLATLHHAEQPPILETRVLRVANVNGTVHILVELSPRRPVWLLKWCLGGHCYLLTDTGSISRTTVEDLIDVDHAYKPGEKLVICYEALEPGKAPPARCISIRLS